MNCKRCDNNVSSDLKFCGQCGYPVIFDKKVIIEKDEVKTKNIGRKIVGVIAALIVLGISLKILMVIFGVIASLILALFGLHGSVNVDISSSLGTIFGFLLGIGLADKTYKKIIGKEEEKNLSKPKKWYQFKGIV